MARARYRLGAGRPGEVLLQALLAGLASASSVAWQESHLRQQRGTQTKDLLARPQTDCSVCAWLGGCKQTCTVPTLHPSTGHYWYGTALPGLQGTGIWGVAIAEEHCRPKVKQMQWRPTSGAA